MIRCTGFEPGFEWIDLPVFGGHDPLHERGVVASAPGLYFVGLHFLNSLSSAMIHGVGRDAERIATHIAGRVAEAERSLEAAPQLAESVAQWLPAVGD